ncbi:MAG TPA: PqqD family protein [Polyangiaceae bacterium]|jgi:hypothetical protein|nr:PqqD family protein [Polyangiaceae bacterium]
MSAPLDFEAILAAIPTANRAVRVEQRAHGAVLFVPLRQRAWTKLARLILPLRPERGYALDRLGEEVWSACDGKRTLEAVVDEFARRHELSFHEARLCVMQFVRMLSERNLLALVVPKPEAERP